MCRLVWLLLLVFILAGCALQPAAPVSDVASPLSSPEAEFAPPSTVVKALQSEARALAPLLRGRLTQAFLAATRSLPSIEPRTIYQHPKTRSYFSRQQAEQLPAVELQALLPVTIDEYRYYHTKYGSPLAYARAIELVDQHGVHEVAGRRILDFGYGSVAHLRLLASLGAHAVGVDVDSYLAALYSEARDTGAVRSSVRGQPGSVTLLSGSYPADSRIADAVGGGYDVIISKNTLKRGYVKPARPAEKRHLIDLGVKEDTFLKHLHAALKPGGLLVIYNLAPAQAAANRPYLPWADAHSPFTRKQYEAAGFRVLAFDANDDQQARDMGRVLGWDKNSKGERQADFDKNLFALYTILRKTD